MAGNGRICKKIFMRRPLDRTTLASYCAAERMARYSPLCLCISSISSQAVGSFSTTGEAVALAIHMPIVKHTIHSIIYNIYIFLCCCVCCLSVCVSVCMCLCTLSLLSLPGWVSLPQPRHLLQLVYVCAQALLQPHYYTYLLDYYIIITTIATLSIKVYTTQAIE